MKLYGIIYAYYATSGVDAYAISEDGKIVAHHFCSNESYALSDLGFIGPISESSEAFNDERKNKYASLGYNELVWLGFNEDDFSNDYREIITETLKEWETFRQSTFDTMRLISTQSNLSKLVVVNSVDISIEDSDLTLEELKIKNAYSAGLFYSNREKLTFENWLEQKYSKQETVNG